MGLSFVLIQVINSVAYGSLLFLIASGFSLIFGLMKITNMTHAVFYMMGSYIGMRIVTMTGNFGLAMLVSGIIVSIVGFLVFKFFLFRLQGNAQSQVLLCIGFLFFFDDLLLVIFTGNPMQIPVPKILDFSITFFGMYFPMYRIFLIAVGIIIAVALVLIVDKTKLGCLVRAGVDDEETVRAIGIDINKLFVIVYIGGTFLAAIGGVLGGPFLGMEPRMCFTIMPLALAVVIIGGLGDLKGAFFGSMVVGLLDTFGRAYFPDFSYFTLFLPMALVLAFKPNGLFSSGKVVDA